jgi:ribosomal protein S18 acetylase RimI-like enzyme
MEKYEFMLADCDDVPEIVNLYHSLIGTPGCTWDLEYPSKESAQSDIGAGCLYILKQSGCISAPAKIVAAASAGTLNELGHLRWKPKNPCELARIGVLPSAQRQGVGTLILQNVIAAMKGKGFDGIRMLVSKTNPAALALYDKNGFERCGETFMFEIDFYCYQMCFKYERHDDQ